MNSLSLSRYALSVCVATTLLAGCGGSQPPVITQGPLTRGQMPEAENALRVNGVGQSLSSIRHASVTETVLHSFRGSPYDGANPESGLTYFKGTLYGTTANGSANTCNSSGAGCGTVYSITPSGTETVLHSFKGGKDGQYPVADLIVLNGTFYGTTFEGGCNQTAGGCGTVFRITPSGGETILHAFAGPPDGLYPTAGLLYANGTMYGTTSGGGEGGRRAAGTAFTITPSGDLRVIHAFQDHKGGAGPNALVDLKGRLYGTTAGGGGGAGTVFSLSSSGTERLLHTFKGGPDGSYPFGGLVAIKHTLYGTTTKGGAANQGTVFSITPSGTETILYSFMGGNDGAGPQATLLNVNGTMYGTTYGGGAYGEGTVFSITPSGTETVLYSFMAGQDGANPVSDLIYVNGTLYGTTEAGGNIYSDGTVFSITL